MAFLQLLAQFFCVQKAHPLTKRLWIFVSTLVLLHLTGAATRAQTLTITFTASAGAIAIGGAGTSSISVNFGNVQAFGGSAPSGVTKSISATGWTLDTSFDVLVTKTGLSSSSYTLKAQLQSADFTDTWKLAGVRLSSASSASLNLLGSYGAKTPYAFALTIPFDASAATISNTVNFLAVAN